MRKFRSAVFWLTYPLLWVYLRLGSRTRVLIVSGGEVLVVKGWHGLDQWGLPGGGLHHGEDPVDGAIREAKEEVGIKLSRKQLHFLLKGRANLKGLKFDYSCYYVEFNRRPKTKKQAIEIVEMEWLPLSNINQDNATSETHIAVQAWLKRSNLL